MIDNNILQRHLTEEDFQKWDQGSMTPDEMEEFLSHTASCSTCAEHWMNWMEQIEPDTLQDAPAYLADEIISRCNQPDLLLAQKINRTSRQLQLLTYSLKVGTAVILSIMMLFSINLTNLKVSSVSRYPAGTETVDTRLPNVKKDDSNITKQINRGAKTITDSLQNFSQSILNFEFHFNQED